MPTCLAKSLAVPTGMMPSGTSYPSRPFTTPFTVPSPPAAATTSAPRRAASAASAAASPGSNVSSGSTKCPFSRTQFTRWRTSGRSARAPWMTSAMCLERMDTASAYHAPVLASEVVELLRRSKRVLDGTLGGGGHTFALLEAGVETLIGIDRDPDALVSASARLADFERAGRFAAVQGNFASIDELPALAGDRFDGIL